MNVTGGSTDVTTYVAMTLLADGTDATGLTITDLDLQYTRSGVAPVAKVDATALAATDSAHADNKAIEIDATDQPGLYRVDWPDAAFAAGVKEVILSVKHTTCKTAHLRVTIDTPVNVTSLNGDQQSLTDLKDFADAGYDPGSNIVQAQLANGVTHGGATALLRLGSSTSTPAFYVTSSGGDAATFEATGANGDGFYVQGNGSGHGLLAVAGSTGDGIHGTGGATSGDGIHTEAANNGRGFHCVAAGNNAGVLFAGAGTGAGFHATGGADGIGFHAVGGSTSGVGFQATATAGSLSIYATNGVQFDGAVTFASTFTVTGATTLTGAVSATNASNDIRGIKVTSDGLALVTAWTVNITGSLSGSVGSVTGAVGSVTGAVGSVTGNVGGNVVGSVASVTGAVGSVTAAVTVGTNNDKTGYALTSGERDSIAAALLDLSNGIETGLTPRQAMKLLAAAAAGKLSGAATTTIVIRNAVADSKARITATVDADGNRSAITTDLT